MSHITSGSVSVAELSEVDGADKAGLSGCNQSQMWSEPSPWWSDHICCVRGRRRGGEGPQLDDL